MEVIVDGERLALPGEAAPDMFALLALVETRLRSRGRGLVSVAVDGVEIPAEASRSELDRRNVQDVQVVEFRSECLATLAEQVLDQVESVLPELPQACNALAEVFQGAHPEEGYEPFQQLAEIWHQVKDRELMVTRALDLQLEGLDVDGKSVARYHEELNQYLEECVQALEKGDCVALGDLLTYELAPRAETEARIAALLRQQARAHAPK